MASMILRKSTQIADRSDNRHKLGHKCGQSRRVANPRLEPQGPKMQQDPEKPVARRKAGQGTPLGHRCELLAQCEVLKEKIAAGAKQPTCQRREERQQT